VLPVPPNKRLLPTVQRAWRVSRRTARSGIELSAEERREMVRLDAKGLEAMIRRIKAERRGRAPPEWSRR